MSLNLAGCNLLTLAETAEVLVVSRRTVRRYIADGHLDAVRLGSRSIRVKAESVERFVNAAPLGISMHTGEHSSGSRLAADRKPRPN